MSKNRKANHHNQIIKFRRHTGANAALLDDSRRAGIMGMSYGRYMAWKRENKQFLEGNR